MVYIKGRSLCRGDCPLPVFQYNIDNANTSLLPRYVRNSIIINTSRFQGGGRFQFANKPLNAFKKWAGCPGGSGPGYSSTNNYVPYQNCSVGPAVAGPQKTCFSNCQNIFPLMRKPPPVPVLLISTDKFNQMIQSKTYYLAKRNTPYVMPHGSFMTSFIVALQGTNNVLSFKNENGDNLFTWNDNTVRNETTYLKTILPEAVNISGCTKFTSNGGDDRGFLASGTDEPGVIYLMIEIYGYYVK
jgi:hypothetical protein